MLITVAVETMTGTLYVVTISMKDTLIFGKPVKNAVTTLKPRCMSITARMNTISRNLRIRQNSSRLIVQNAKKLSVWDMMVTPYIWGSITAWNARQPCDDFCSCRTKVLPQFMEVRLSGLAQLARRASMY